MKLKIKLYQILFLILCIQFAYGQATEVFEGYVTLDDKVYEANYEYYLSKKDTIYHGPFSLSEQLDGETGKEAVHFTAIDGNYRTNKPHGAWSLRKGDITPTGKAVFGNDTYNYKINGREFLASGNFTNGVKNGTWQIYEWDIENSRKKDTLLSAVLPFRNNAINGEFTLFYQGELLEGFINGNQFTAGKWSFYKVGNNGKKDLLTEWIFSQNILKTKIIYTNGKPETIDLNSASKEEVVVEEIPFSENYLKIIDLKASLNDAGIVIEQQEEKRVRDLFFNITQNLQEVTETFRPVTNIRIIPDIKTKIEKYPYTPNEIALLDIIKQNTLTADSISNSIRENPQVHLAKIATEEVAYHAGTLRAIDRQFIEPYKMIVENYENGNLEYVHRNRFISRRITKPKALNVHYEYNKDSINSNYAMVHLQVDENLPPIEQLVVLSEQIVTEIVEIKNSMSPYLQEIEQEESIVQMETEVIKKHEQIKRLTDSLIDVPQQQLAGYDLKQELDNFADLVLKNYSQLRTTQEKAAQVELSLECLNHLESLVLTLHNAPENAQFVEAAYTNRVFNPYTYTYMEEKVKAPIYESYEKLLLPAMFENLRRMDCSNIQEYKTNFDTVFDSMIAILKQGTRREERRIRRANTPSQVSDILDLGLRF